MTWVVDASVAAKWFFEEELTDKASSIIQSNRPLLAPDLIFAEVCNVAWKRVRQREISRAHAIAVASALPGMFSLITPNSEILDEALELALKLDHPVYDCLYLSLAKARDVSLVTADAGLARLAKKKRAGITVEYLAEVKL